MVSHNRSKYLAGPKHAPNDKVESSLNGRDSASDRKRVKKKSRRDSVDVGRNAPLIGNSTDTGLKSRVR